MRRRTLESKPHNATRLYDTLALSYIRDLARLVSALWWDDISINIEALEPDQSAQTSQLSLASDNKRFGSHWCRHQQFVSWHCGLRREKPINWSGIRWTCWWKSKKNKWGDKYRGYYANPLGWICPLKHTHCHYRIAKFSPRESLDQSVITTQWLFSQKELDDGECSSYRSLTMRKPRTTNSAGMSKRERFGIGECVSKSFLLFMFLPPETKRVNVSE